MPVSTGSTSSASSSPATTSGEQQSLPANGAPEVASPLDTGSYQQNPCKVLTQAQASQLNVAFPGKSDPGGLGAGCNWANLDTESNIRVEFGDRDPTGLSSVYGLKNSGSYAYFEEIPDLAGYPAVAADQVDSRSTGECILYVGVSDQQAIQIGTRQSSNKVGTVDACTVTKQVASMMLQTMKA